MPDKQIRILLVDDFATMRKIIRNLLKQIGYENVEEAEDGLMALERLKVNTFGLVISDWNMPRMTGLDMLKAIRADDGLKSLPVLMVTAENELEKVKNAISAGVNNYIVKPFTAKTLLEKLGQVFESQPESSADRPGPP
ncbi:MAG: response regulator [Nitrospirae bacterium]|nr:response regulator [Nitrospirota bacterium]